MRCFWRRFKICWRRVKISWISFYWRRWGLINSIPCPISIRILIRLSRNPWLGGSCLMRKEAPIGGKSSGGKLFSRIWICRKRMRRKRKVISKIHQVQRLVFLDIILFPSFDLFSYCLTFSHYFTKKSIKYVTF